MTEGNECAEFFLEILAADKDRMTVIDQGKKFYERVYSAYNVGAILGNPCQEHVLEEVGVRNFNMIVTLGPEDTDNFEICQIGKRIFGIRETLYLVRNPRDAELFEESGADQTMNTPVIIAGALQDISGC